MHPRVHAVERVHFTRAPWIVETLCSAAESLRVASGGVCRTRTRYSLHRTRRARRGQRVAAQNVDLIPPVLPYSRWLGRVYPAWSGCSGGNQRDDGVELRCDALALDFDVVAVLQVHPEPLARREVPSQPQGGIRGDAALAVHDLVDSPRRNVDRDGKVVLRNSDGLDVLLVENLARCDDVEQCAFWAFMVAPRAVALAGLCQW